MSKTKSVLVLFSGGLDSTVLIKHYLNKGWDTTGLFINHFQPQDDIEKKAVSLVYDYLRGCFSHERFRLESYMRVYNGFEYNGYFGPVRNSYLLILAVNMAYIKGIRNVAIGVSHGEYLDTRPEFIDRFNFMLDFCMDKPPYVLAPFAHWSKERVIKYGIKIGAPLHLTYSCMSSPRCGTCQDCKLRKKYKIDPEEKNVSTG